MKKLGKIALALMLCLSLVAGVTAFAAPQGDVHTNCGGNCGNNPVIILPGISMSPSVVYDENGEKAVDGNGKVLQGGLMIIDSTEVVDFALKSLILPLLATLFTQKDAMGFTDKIYETICVAFDTQKTLDDGSSKHDVRVAEMPWPVSEMDNGKDYDKNWFYRTYPVADVVAKIGEDHCYVFNYQLIGNPVDAAAKLNDFIQTVKAQTGHSKVNFINLSLGGSVFTAYIDQFGHADLGKVINGVALLDGSELFARLLAREFNLSDQFIFHEFFPMIMDQEGPGAWAGYLINLLVRFLPRSVFEDTLTRLTDGLLETFILNAGQFWAMVPSAKYPELAQRYLADPAKAAFKVKTDAFYQAQLNLKQNILDAVADGVIVQNLAGTNLGIGEQRYTFFSIIADSDKINSDGVIHLGSTTLGATAAPLGEKLSDEYLAGKDPKYISPDQSFDLSTALLPDNTWVFIGQHHEADDNAALMNLAQELVLNDELVNVNSNPEKHPQFNKVCNIDNVKKNLQPKAIAALKEYNDGNVQYTADQVAKLEAAIARGEAAMKTFIGDQDMIAEAELALILILTELNMLQPKVETFDLYAILTPILKVLSKAVLKFHGAIGYFD